MANYCARLEWPLAEQGAMSEAGGGGRGEGEDKMLDLTN